MTDKTNPATRRALIVGAATLAGLPFLVQPKEAHAAGTLPKANAKYQDKPSGANRCGLCNYFIAGASATAVGQCKVVAGPISPTGWCTLFVPKRK